MYTDPVVTKICRIVCAYVQNTCVKVLAVRILKILYAATLLGHRVLNQEKLTIFIVEASNMANAYLEERRQLSCKKADKLNRLLKKHDQVRWNTVSGEGENMCTKKELVVWWCTPAGEVVLNHCFGKLHLYMSQATTHALVHRAKLCSK